MVCADAVVGTYSPRKGFLGVPLYRSLAMNLPYYARIKFAVSAGTLCAVHFPHSRAHALTEIGLNKSKADGPPLESCGNERANVSTILQRALNHMKFVISERNELVEYLGSTSVREAVLAWAGRRIVADFRIHTVYNSPWSTRKRIAGKFLPICKLRYVFPACLQISSDL